MRDRWHALRTFVLPLVVVGAQLVAAYLVLGLPDLRAAEDFLTSNLPTMAGSLAASQVLLWLLLAVAFGSQVVAAAGPAIAAVDRRRSARLWSVAVMVAGLLVLAAGVGHHLSATAVDISGGSLDEAKAQLAR